MVVSLKLSPILLLDCGRADKLLVNAGLRRPPAAADGIDTKFAAQLGCCDLIDGKLCASF
jgi:hypothetical protein